MKPDADYLIRSLATNIANEVIPMVGTEYVRANLKLIVKLMFAAAADFDHAAARLIEENRQMRLIFSNALAVVEDDDLKESLKKAADGVDDDYRVSALDEKNRTLRTLLIDLHAHVEMVEGKGARRTEEAIWRELRDSTQRRLHAIMGIAGANSLLQDA